MPGAARCSSPQDSGVDRHETPSRRGGALVVGAATLVLAVAVAVSEFPRGLGLLVCVVIAGARGLVRRAPARVRAGRGLAVAVLALAGALGLSSAGGPASSTCSSLAGVVVTLAAHAAALAVHVDLPACPGPAAPGAVLQPALRRREGGTVRARRAGAAAWASSRSS